MKSTTKVIGVLSLYAFLHVTLLEKNLQTTIKQHLTGAAVDEKATTSSASTAPPKTSSIYWSTAVVKLQQEEARRGNENDSDSSPPVWSSAYARRQQQQARKDSIDLATAKLKWWKMNTHKPEEIASINRDLEDAVLRSGKELLVYGLGGILPYFGTLLPRVRFDKPLDPNASMIEIAIVPDLVDAFLDLHECDKGRATMNSTTVHDGMYNVCFSAFNSGGRRAAERRCKKKDGRRVMYPLPGHEIWSCDDTAVMEQMVGGLVMDFLTEHWDRFLPSETNNLFFLKHEYPRKFVFIDHHGDKIDGTRKNFREWVSRDRTKMLLRYKLSQELRKNLRAVRLEGTKKDFVRQFNASVDGQLEGLTQMVVEPEKIRSVPVGTVLTEDLWMKFQALVDHYNITLDEED